MKQSRIAAPTAALLVLGLATGAWYAQAQTPYKADAKSVERGRYLVSIAGCNDCHTPGYLVTDGKVPEKEWLTGDRLGWKGPWGTTYAPNLRLKLAAVSEDQWVLTAKTAQYRPPMPWFNLHKITESDLRDIYRFVRTLGPAGTPAPAWVPPNEPVAGPVVIFPEPPPAAAGKVSAR